MPSEPLERVTPAHLGAELGIAWYELTAVDVLPHATSVWSRQHLGAVASWAAVWRPLEAAIIVRVREGETLSSIAAAGGITTKALTDIRAGRTWPDSLSVLRLAAALGLELGVEGVR